MNNKKTINLDVLCAGKLYVDIVFTGVPRLPVLGEEILSDDLAISLGGGATFCAAGISCLGLKTGIMGNIVNNCWGSYIIRELLSYNVNIDSLVKINHGENNISISINVVNDRSMLACAKVDDYSEALNHKKKISILAANHLHVKGLSASRANAIKFAKDSGLTTSLDINLQTTNQAETILEILPYIDIFLPSAWEVATLFGSSPKKIVKELGKLTNGYCVIKQGKKGSIASDGKFIVEQTSRPTKILDATGAGDAYDTGFLWAYLRNDSIEKCLKAGTIAAELCLQTIGGAGWFNKINDFHELTSTY